MKTSKVNLIVKSMLMIAYTGSCAAASETELYKEFFSGYDVTRTLEQLCKIDSIENISIGSKHFTKEGICSNDDKSLVSLLKSNEASSFPNLRRNGSDKRILGLGNIDDSSVFKKNNKAYLGSKYLRVIASPVYILNEPVSIDFDFSYNQSDGVPLIEKHSENIKQWPLSNAEKKHLKISNNNINYVEYLHTITLRGRKFLNKENRKRMYGHFLQKAIDSGEEVHNDYYFKVKSKREGATETFQGRVIALLEYSSKESLYKELHQQENNKENKTDNWLALLVDFLNET